jgi:predicted membrane channel-forming protein YqfA (hemolysin III family)
MANEAPATIVPTIEKRVRQAAVLICLGLLVLLLTLLRIHPLAFMAFILIGCPLVSAGIVLYLYSIVSHHSEPR